jgi:uncharacterized membrane protein
MATGAPQTFRLPLILLAAVNLAALGLLLWPWQEALILPVGGSSAIDPAVTLLAYMGLLYWISSGIHETTRKALSAGAEIGLTAGLVLVLRVLLAARPGVLPIYVQPGLMGVAVILCGVAGLRGSKVGGSIGMGALSGLWCAMAGSLMAAAAILMELYFAGPIQPSTDSWKQYQGLAIGNTATQGLVHSLNSATAFLLLGPLAGSAIGLIFAFFAQNQQT